MSNGRDAAANDVGAAPSQTTVLRVLFFGAIAVALSVAIWFQRDTITGAVGEVGNLSVVAVIGLLTLTAFERWSRADIVRRLLGPPVTIGTAVVIHDVGTAVSKGVPLGGALGTALRWSISRESGVVAPRFATMLIAYGVATTFASWMLPLAALVADLTQRSATLTDLALLAVIVAVLAGSALFWYVTLRSNRVEQWSVGWTQRMWARFARRVSALDGIDPASGVRDVRSELRSIGRRPWSLLARTLAAQACGSMILLVALRSLGVGDELGLTEFLRVFFVAHLAGTFAPTPGGVGVVEAGTTGALVAAGVDTTTALAGVLVYRFLTYVVPIMFGAMLYVVWRARKAGRLIRFSPVPEATLSGHGASIDT